jgi:hypothetical protein
MTSQAVDGVCAFAWRNYLLLHSGISENDSRLFALYRYVADLGGGIGRVFGTQCGAGCLATNQNEGVNSMADKTEIHFAPQSRLTTATAIGMNALKPVMRFQVSMLRMWG